LENISKEQIKSIYALGASLNIVGRGTSDDNLHQLVEGITGKDSVLGLTQAEADKVLAELRQRMRLENQTAPLKSKKQHPEKPGGLTSSQQKKIWAMMYELRSYDEKPNPASLGDRLAGIIRKELHIDATAQNPFAWLNHPDGTILIDQKLKNYIRSAKRKALARRDTG